MNKYRVGSDPSKFPRPDPLSPSCELPHPYWEGESCEEATEWGALRTTWNALFSSENTVRAHCLNSPLLLSRVRKYLVDDYDLKYHSTDPHLRQALSWNPRLTPLEVIRVLSSYEDDRRAIAENKAVLNSPEVVYWVNQQSDYISKWFSGVQGLSAKTYELLAEKPANWWNLANNCEVPESVISKLLTVEDDPDLILAVIESNDVPIGALFEVSDCGSATLKEVILEHLTHRADEATTWVADNYPDMVNVPYEWVRELTAPGSK